MGNSLQDQLLQAGMIAKQKAKKIKKAKHKQDKQQRKTKRPVSDQVKQQAQQAQQQKVARDRELNRQKQQAAEQRAVVAQIRQLIEQNQVSVEEGAEIAYNFTDGSKIRRIHVSEGQHALLSNGRLAVVRQGEGYAMVPAVVAEKIRQRDASVILVLNESQPQDDEDDPYADFKVPDDLMW
ncbi:nucleoprotein/polynucleotide-associated enzyme [Candidatus Endoriftia persephone str. Guaymas]|jgi:uncharacterized protein YaiL (DUF2058 family)|uniref:Uncharacterized protein YaiL n=3 Tax=Gammaproteobacteria TaxID=1236 RepID=G2FCC3_9GAMM|nr:DUF2058 domain-containing protein [Candidatus Endoriftia persephone]EGV52504.1 uncharacterized protein YaiL [endosymbiont of Riftia pachyptila (vent Ph05)]EGW55486.1 uncharacterized protein YaiL [endosymbiont of Tevnia jerichonana (vent Tica)]MBA1330163.1 nucleoprotein/polynucleotide-associated enzyme [Candidatus Endoriftia persephone str. Guaymas]USF86641.1 DUF2058 domain-containing protein [Candidatus Endoriftia persephone]